MALPLPQGQKIQIYKRRLSSEFTMNSMEAATDHYSIGLIIHGDRTIITPKMTYTAHAGDVITIASDIYHRTVPASKEYYESILIKFAEEFADDMCKKLGKHVLDHIYEYPLKSFNDPVVKSKINNLAEDMLAVYESDAYSDTTIKNYTLQLMLYQILLLMYEHNVANDNTYPTPLSPQVMDAIYYIESNFMNSPRIEKASQIAGYSVSYFSRLFQNQLGLSFSEYCTNVKLKHVAHALLSTNKSVMEISLEMGFSHPGNLTSCFKKKYGMTPMQYRKQNTPHNIN